MVEIKYYAGTMSPRFQVILFVCVLALLASGIWFTYNAIHLTNQTTVDAIGSTNVHQPSKISNFQQCVAAGNPVQQSSPETCTTKSGKRFTQNAQ